MELHDIPPGAVVVGIDGSHHSDQALDWAAQQAIAESRELVLLHAVTGTRATEAWMHSSQVDPAPYLRDADAAGQQILVTALLDLGPARTPRTVHSVLCREDPRMALLEAAERASVVVVGSRGRGPVQSLLLGSVSSAVAAHSRCAAVVVRPHHQGRVRHGVLVGADGSAGSTPALEFAFRQAAHQHLPLTVLHVVWDALAEATDPERVWPPDAAHSRAVLAVEESVAGLVEKFPDVQVQQSVVRGGAPAGILALADTMDLVVVGHARKQHISRLPWGSVALKVLEHAATVVAVVPED